MIADTIPRMKLMSSLGNLVYPLILSFPSWAGVVMMLYAVASYGQASLNFRRVWRAFT